MIVSDSWKVKIEARIRRLWYHNVSPMISKCTLCYHNYTLFPA